MDLEVPASSLGPLPIKTALEVQLYSSSASLSAEDRFERYESVSNAGIEHYS